VKTALVFPPVCDPTMPYISLPVLASVLRREGFEVQLIDANVEGLEFVLARDSLSDLAGKVRSRLRKLERKAHLSHPEQLAWLALREAEPLAHDVPRVGDALGVFRDRSGKLFYDPKAYGSAADTVDAAFQLLSAAYAPLRMDLRSYRTPFSFLSADEIAHDAGREHDPFNRYFEEELAPRLALAGVGLIGVSMAFPGQLQPAWSMAFALKRHCPDAVLVAGGPALTQRMAGLPAEALDELLSPFDVAVLGEGEKAIVSLARSVRAGERPSGILVGDVADPASLPAPDFDGMPLGRYWSCEPVLPYDASRGCYWGRCAFCHYGPVAHGTAQFRERGLERIIDDLASFRTRGARIAYLSHDTLSPSLGARIARGMRDSGSGLRWASDIRPEAVLTAKGCEELASGGALAFSLGIESGSSRLLELMGKGTTPGVVSGVLRNLASAGMAAEAMLFTDFPTESRDEALDTVAFLERHWEEVALFVCGTFGLTRGSAVYRDSGAYGVAETWHVAGDRFLSGVFWREVRESKSAADRDAVDAALARVSRKWRLRQYPWAGSLSTAHTLLWYDRFGPGVFRSRGPAAPAEPAFRRPSRSRHDYGAISRAAPRREADIWHTLTHVERRVTRRDWRKASL